MAGLIALALPAHADLTGFSQFAPINSVGKTTLVGLNSDQTSMTLTDGGPHEATSIFASTPQRITSWRAEFTYQGTGTEGSAPADGIAFVLQNDPRGVKALGDDGSALGYGYGETVAIRHSAAFQLDVYQGGGEALAINGSTGTYGDTGDVDLTSGDPIHVTLTYDGAVLTETLKDLTTGETSTHEDAINLSSTVGSSTALVGFTGGSGDATAMQTIRDFSFQTLPNVPPALRKHLIPVKAAPMPLKIYKTLDDYVDPMIGTGSGPGGGCNTFPGPAAPFGMVQFSPDTSAPGIGYGYTDRHIQGFSMTHMSGVGCSDDGAVFLTATTGPIKTQVQQYSSAYSHTQESSSPGYYQVKLRRFGVNAELTATTRAGLIRFTFPTGKPANILLPISHTLTQTYGASAQIIGHDEIDGQVTSQSFCGAPARSTVYFVVRFDRPFQTSGTWTGDAISQSNRSVSQPDTKAPAIGAYIRYPAGQPKSVTARIGISYVDLAGARANLQAEVGSLSFDAIRQQTARAWDKELGIMQVRGGTTTQRTTFYTALYHSLLMPNVFSDGDGRYIGYDEKIHQVPHGHTLYANFSGWDIYRTEVPLLGLIEPQRLQDMCQSIVEMYRQGGWIDRWPQNNTYTNVMCGSPLTSIMATTWNDRLHGFDMQTAYQGMMLDATQSPPPGKPYYGEDNIGYMNKIGYIPDDKEGYGSVSQTEEDCIAYASLASVAQSLGHTSDANFMRSRALNYRNNFDPATKFMRPKLLDDSWQMPFLPTQEHGYVEGSAWHYRWLAPQDMAGLIQLFGGDAAFNAQLDQFFDYPKPEWVNQFYTPYNETDLEAPFLYDYSGAPWKTQARVRELQRDAYDTTPSGIPGNDDCGTMSAWYVLSALGLYQVDPSRPDFVLCSPLFPQVTVRLSHPYTGKTFVIRAPAASLGAQYIESVHLNGLASAKPWVSQAELVHGSTLSFALGNVPNKHWGTAANARPFSLSTSSRK
jgi:predicted alpha-1,2-mannosidase